jgi:hypothetical protein
MLTEEIPPIEEGNMTTPEDAELVTPEDAELVPEEGNMTTPEDAELVPEEGNMTLPEINALDAEGENGTIPEGPGENGTIPEGPGENGTIPEGPGENGTIPEGPGENGTIPPRAVAKAVPDDSGPFLADHIPSGQVVELVGDDSSPGNSSSSLQYEWSVGGNVSGPADPKASKTFFIPLSAGIYIPELTVTEILKGGTIGGKNTARTSNIYVCNAGSPGCGTDGSNGGPGGGGPSSGGSPGGPSGGGSPGGPGGGSGGSPGSGNKTSPGSKGAASVNLEESLSSKFKTKLAIANTNPSTIPKLIKPNTNCDPLQESNKLGPTAIPPKELLILLSMDKCKLKQGTILAEIPKNPNLKILAGDFDKLQIIVVNATDLQKTSPGTPNLSSMKLVKLTAQMTGKDLKTASTKSLSTINGVVLWNAGTTPINTTAVHNAEVMATFSK